MAQGLPVSVDGVFGLDEYPAALARLESGRAARASSSCATTSVRGVPAAMDLAAAKERLRQAVEARADLLVEASHQIHAHPELNYEEQFAHDLLTGHPGGRGPRGGAVGLRARHRVRGPGRLRPAPRSRCSASTTRCPGIGHACGHNIIATAGLGAGLAAAVAGRGAGRPGGRDGHAGRGGGRRQDPAWPARAPSTGVDAALMVHPAGVRPRPHGRDRRPGAHRARTRARPPTPPPSRTGAATPSTPRCSATLNVAALRQHIRPERAGPRDLHAGRRQAEHRPGPRRDGVDGPLREHPHARPAQGPGGRLPRGGGHRRRAARWSSAWKPVVYADMLDNEVIVGLYAANSERAGPPGGRARPAGRRSWAAPTWATSATSCPSIHPMIQAAPTGVPIHTPGVRHPRRPATRGTGPWSTGPSRWPGRWPTCGSRRASSTPCGPSSTPRWPPWARRPGRSAIEGGAGA